MLGVRLALKGLELAGTRNPRELIIFIENDRCIADAIQIVSGTRIGRRSAKLINYGKMATTFINTETGVAHRINVRRVDPGIRRDEESIRQALHTPDADLLNWRKVTVSLRPEDFPGKPLRTVDCVRCEEKVFDGRDIEGDAGPLCVPCAGAAYYQVLEERG